jgi:hypothetical protein
MSLCIHSDSFRSKPLYWLARSHYRSIVPRAAPAAPFRGRTLAQAVPSNFPKLCLVESAQFSSVRRTSQNVFIRSMDELVWIRYATNELGDCECAQSHF